MWVWLGVRVTTNRLRFSEGSQSVRVRVPGRVAHDNFQLSAKGGRYNVKVPIAVELLTRVDAGEMSLEDRIDIGVEAYSPGSGMLAKLLDDPGLSVSLLNLLEIMLLISDNTATDRLLEHVGGGEVVTARMATLGVEGVRVDRSTLRLIGDWLGVEDMPSASGRTWEDYEALVYQTESFPD